MKRATKVRLARAAAKKCVCLHSRLAHRRDAHRECRLPFCSCQSFVEAS